MTDFDKTRLVSLAKEAAQKSYSPYSKFSVGAALVTESGEIFTGCNVETAAYVVNCAERTALYSAIAAGHRDFKAIAVVAPDSHAECFPCGVCRQVLSEFCDGDFVVITLDKFGKINQTTLKELLPHSFSRDNLS